MDEGVEALTRTHIDASVSSACGMHPFGCVMFDIFRTGSNVLVPQPDCYFCLPLRKVVDRFFQSIHEIVRRHAAGRCKKLVMQTAAVTFSERMKPRQALEQGKWMFASDKRTLNSSVLVNEVAHAVRLGVSISIVFFRRGSCAET